MMHHFKIDLSSADAVRFDRTLDAFVESELLLRPDIDLQITRYSKEPGVERRAVFISSRDHLRELLKRLTVGIRYSRRLRRIDEGDADA